MTDRFSLAGRVALVTGASRGLGFARDEALAAHGAKVILNARDEKSLADAARRLKAEHAAFDVTDSKHSQDALTKIVAQHGKLDILVNNAGIQHRRALTEWEDAE